MVHASMGRACQSEGGAGAMAGMRRVVSEAETRDLIIAGGGAAGLALATALAGRLGPAFRILLCEPAALGVATEDGRAYAVAAGPRRFLASLGIWERLAPRAQAMTAMAISDSALADLYRPVLLSFTGEVAPGEPFAHMVPQAPLIEVLSAAARGAGVEIAATRVLAATPQGGAIRAELEDGRSVRAPLLVAADGARSRLRMAAGIASHGWSYGQSAIVATIAHERAHGGRAVQHFLPGGPFAMLPLKAPDGTGTWSSIVWSERRETARRLISGDPARFEEALAQRFGAELGRISVVGKPKLFPLEMRLARRLVAERLVLLGDAARTIHPLAGQGLNLGLKDAAALADCVQGAARLGLDYGAAGVLERYQSHRRFDGAAMAVATDGLNRLFGLPGPGARTVREIGLGLVDRLPPLKRLLIGEAAGTHAGRGERSSTRSSS
jgi:2-octaprenyl-6-methoxyphenol hydroxylase